MKISFAWLRELVALPASVTVEDVAARLTLAGLEIEGLHRLADGLTGTKVVSVVSTRPHPGADKLRLVTVDTGQGQEEVVCGAPNVPVPGGSGPGGKVVWAPPGATLPGGMTLSRRDVRGVSSPGMLCSEVELGLADKAEGLLILPAEAPAGADFATYAGLPDTVLEVNVTANRSDALSHVGVAREVGALFGVPWKKPVVSERAFVASEGGLPVTISDPSLCPRYQATIVEGLAVKPSPLRVRLRLESCGVRAISNLVDVTNLVMLETGHPLHAFDADKVVGGIVVRCAKEGEALVTLDGVERALEPTNLVIADAEKALALAGVMGGAASEVTASTKRILLEAATFRPATIRKTAKRLGLSSEASYRFERSVDPNGLSLATARAVDLLVALGGGGAVGPTRDLYPAPPPEKKVTLSLAALHRLAGTSICTADEASARLNAIGVVNTVEAAAGDHRLEARVPSFRPDLSIEQDLAEEVLRLVGYQAIPARLPTGGKAPTTSPEALADAARDALAALGCHEVALWAFVPETWQVALDHAPARAGARVRNPISSDYEIMRTTLLPGLVETARRNVSRGLGDVRIFEVGPVVLGDAQPTVAAALLTGHASGWLKPGEALDYFDAKGVLEGLLTTLGASEVTFEPFASGAPAFLHPGLSASLRSDAGLEIGWVGEVHPRYLKKMDLEGRVLAFEIDISLLGSSAKALRSAPPPRFPAASRDISFWIDVAVTADSQRAAFASAAEVLLRELAVREDFRDPRYTPAGKKGMLWSLTYRLDNRTLTDAEVDAAHARVVDALKARFSVAVR